MSRRAVTVTAVAAYLGSIVLANWLTTRYGFVPVGFGETATAGTFAAGGALVVRDLVQDAFGLRRRPVRRLAVLGALILLGAGLSFLVAAPAIAWASAAAFAVSETLETLAYTPLRDRAEFGDRRWSAAVAAGAILGSIADSIVFLTIAFGWTAVRPALPGQLVGKLEVAAVFIAAGMLVRIRTRRELAA